jgi:hypothetical protein
MKYWTHWIVAEQNWCIMTNRHYLRCTLNDKLVSEALPNIFRQDLLDEGIHKTGHAGFNFALDRTPKTGDV